MDDRDFNQMQRGIERLNAMVGASIRAQANQPEPAPAAEQALD